MHTGNVTWLTIISNFLMSNFYHGMHFGLINVCFGNKHLVNMSLKARALYTFQSENKEEISISENEELVILDEHPVDGWLQGENSQGERGLFPASYVEIIEPHTSSYLTDWFQCPASSPRTDCHYHPPACYTPAHTPRSCDNDDDDWDDDWEDSSTAEEEPPPQPGVRANGYTWGNSSARHGLRPRSECHGGMSSSLRAGSLGRNLNRFSSFVRSGVEAFVLGDVLLMGKLAESYSIEMGPWGPRWTESPRPFSCSVEDPTKQTKFKGMKSYIAYCVTPSHTGLPVYRRYKHFDWLYGRLLHKFTIISLPHLPEKQARGRFEEDFVEKRQRRLTLWMGHVASHPVLSRYDALEHFLTCGEGRQWKMGKRRAERDDTVGAHFMLTLRVPSEHQDLQDVEERIDAFKAFARRMDDSVTQLAHVASELVCKHTGGFRKEFHRLGRAFEDVSQAFTLDPPYSSNALNSAISHTGQTYKNIGEMFSQQPKYDLFHMLDRLSLYQGLLDNFPDMIHVQKGAFAKVKESQRMSDEGRMDQDEAAGVQRRCRTVGFALQAEMSHFHERRVVDFKEMMQAYLREQVSFYQRLGQCLELALRMYDHL